MTTFGEVSVSLALKSRPEISGVCKVSRYPGLTHVNLGESRTLPMFTPRLHIPPPINTFEVVAAASTRGIERISSSNCRSNGLSWAAGSLSRFVSKDAIRIPVVRKPGSSVIKLRKLRTNSSAPATRTTEIEIWQCCKFQNGTRVRREDFVPLNLRRPLRRVR